MTSISIRVGKNIRKIREKKKMSQGDISRKLNMDRGYISSLENGKRNPTIETLDKISKALDIDTDKLVR